jgi:hypothetical protein
MKDEHNAIVELSDAQSNPYLATGQDFEVTSGDEAPATPFHGQCGKSKSEYKRLVAQGAKKANASSYADSPEQHPNVNDATVPHTV